jgi:hypothetical protein
MSVAPDDPYALPPHRRTAEFGGSSADLLWQIADAELPETLSFRRDSLEHGLIEPAVAMPLGDYRDALADTQPSWELYQ